MVSLFVMRPRRDLINLSVVHREGKVYLWFAIKFMLMTGIITLDDNLILDHCILLYRDQRLACGQVPSSRGGLANTADPFDGLPTLAQTL
jgi:hypothetical protein